MMKSGKLGILISKQLCSMEIFYSVPQKCVCVTFAYFRLSRYHLKRDFYYELKNSSYQYGEDIAISTEAFYIHVFAI